MQNMNTYIYKRTTIKIMYTSLERQIILIFRAAILAYASCKYWTSALWYCIVFSFIRFKVSLYSIKSLILYCKKRRGLSVEVFLEKKKNAAFIIDKMFSMGRVLWQPQSGRDYRAGAYEKKKSRRTQIKIKLPAKVKIFFIIIYFFIKTARWDRAFFGVRRLGSRLLGRESLCEDNLKENYNCNWVLLRSG